MNLSEHVQAHVARGGRVESYSDHFAVIVYGKRLHPIWQLLHIVLTICTLGLWLAVWLPIDRANRERRVVLTMDEYGRVREQTHKQPISVYDKMHARRQTT